MLVVMLTSIDEHAQEYEREGDVSIGNLSRDGQEASGGGCLSSIHETAMRFGVSTFTVRRLVRAKQLRAVRVGKRVLIPDVEIARVITEGCGKHVDQRAQ